MWIKIVRKLLGLISRMLIFVYKLYISMKKLDYEDPRVLKAVEMYESGISVSPICKELKMDGGALRSVLKSLGVLRTRNEAGRVGKGINSLNDNCLDVLTPEALYWIGFLYADGHIDRDRPRIVLTLAGKDRTHLEKCKKFFGEGLTIQEIAVNGMAPGQINPSKNAFRVGFSSVRIYEKLKSLGFTNNKTLTLDPHPNLKFSRDFWRGVVDGDGWICMNNDARAGGKYNYPVIGLSGTEATILEFIDYLNSNDINTKGYPKKDRRSNVYQFDTNASKAIKAMHLLYKDALVYLDRKYNEYINISTIFAE